MALRFEELIERHHDEIFAYLWRLTGNDGRRDAATDVEDLTQDVFLRAYDSFAGCGRTAITERGSTRLRPIAPTLNFAE